MLASRTLVSRLLRGWETFLYTLKAGPAGGRLRRPSSRRQRHDGHRGAGLTHTTGGARATTSAPLYCGAGCSKLAGLGGRNHL